MLRDAYKPQVAATLARFLSCCPTLLSYATFEVQNEHLAFSTHRLMPVSCWKSQKRKFGNDPTGALAEHLVADGVKRIAALPQFSFLDMEIFLKTVVGLGKAAQNMGSPLSDLKHVPMLDEQGLLSAAGNDIEGI